MNKFFKLISITIIVLVLSVLMLDNLFRKFDNRDIDNTNKFKTMPMHINMCNFGSSHGLYGFSYDLLDQRKYVTFNFGLSSQSLSYDYRILKMYISHFDEEAIVFIPISYFSLIGIQEEKSNGFLEKNKRYYKILSPELIKQYDIYTDFFVSKFPSLVRYEYLATDLLKFVINKGTSDNMHEWRVSINEKLNLLYNDAKRLL